MLSDFSIDEIPSVIKSEDNLICIFDYLLKEGFNLSEAFNFMIDKYGEEEIEKFLAKE